MAKEKTLFVCTNCGTEAAKWSGQCHACGAWNTLREEKLTKKTTREVRTTSWKDTSPKSVKQPINLKEVQLGHTVRLASPDQELNRVLGGGIVQGALILLGGQPGIGKSTLLLQLSLLLEQKVLYISGEESEEQIKMRAERLVTVNEQCYIYAETNVSTILSKAGELLPELIIVDSIQTLSSPYVDSTAGTVSQIRECTAELQRFAKDRSIPIFVVGHITKDGSIAGPKLLEHMVDVVLQFEGDQQYSFRILRSLKNRFGSTNEIGIYEMQSSGLRQVSNPSELLISQENEGLSGSAIAAALEGVRPILIEVQALVAPAIYGTPQRSATGYDLRRLSMLMAVLEKRCGLAFGQNDVYLNIAGGIKIADPALDLAVVIALISSLLNVPVPKSIAFAGEVGLSGEVRQVSRISQRMLEADRLGFDAMCVPSSAEKGPSVDDYSMRISYVNTLQDVLEEYFGDSL